MCEKAEIEILLRVVKGDADQRITLATCDIPRIIKLAERHKVVYQLLVFAQQHATFFTPEQMARLETRCRQAALHSLTQLHELKRIAGVLNEKGIGYACIKGPQLSRMIYGREALKESVDLDIMLVHEGDLTQVHELLSGMGYIRSNLNKYKKGLLRKIFLIAKREVAYFNREKRCAIDLHIRPGSNTYLTAGYFKGFFSVLKTDDLEGTPVKVLPDEAYFVYLCYHGALHQFSRLAWLMDIRAFLLIKNNDLDHQVLLNIARELRVERCVCLALVLLKNYFGDDFAEMHCTASLRNAPMKYLAASCRRMLNRDAEYGLSLPGRINKVMYVMMLIKGIEGKLDWLYGIFMRQLAKFSASLLIRMQDR